MEIGKLDQIINLLSYTEVDTDGEISGSYTDEGETFARVITQKGSEAFEAARTKSKEIIRVMIRYRDDVNEQWRLTWQGREYSIVAPPDVSGHRRGEIWLTCEMV